MYQYEKSPYISHFDLGSQLRGISLTGIRVPHLHSSNTIPNDYGSKKLPPGHVMDDHGNVVNLSVLEIKANKILITK